MFRVLRQPTNTEGRFAAAPDGTRLQDVPVRIRSASNPGGPGHMWVRARFVDSVTRLPGVAFLPALFTDNPHLDSAEYEQLLTHLPSLERARLLRGDWDVSEEGDKFRREWFPQVLLSQLEPAVKQIRYWDLAATEVSARNRDPDYTVGLLLQVDRNGTFTIRDIVRGRWNERTVEDIVRDTAKTDGTQVPIHIEQEPGSAGKLLISHFRRTVLPGYACHTGLIGGLNKELRARPVAAAASHGLVRIAPNPHLHDFLDEVAIFPNGPHDDIVDALSGARNALARAGGPATIHNPANLQLSTRSRTPRAGGINRIADNAPLTDREANQLATTAGITVYNPNQWRL